MDFFYSKQNKGNLFVYNFLSFLSKIHILILNI